MSKPEKKNIPDFCKAEECGDVSYNRGYNKACNDWEAYNKERYTRNKIEDIITSNRLTTQQKIKAIQEIY